MNVNWGRFLVAAVLAHSVAALLAFVMDQVYVAGLYLVVIVPLVALAVMSGPLVWTISVGHCRSRIVAALLALSLSATVYIGHYAAGLMREARSQGVSAIEQLRYLPEYIQFRATTDVVKDPHRLPSAAPESDPETASPFNLLLYGLEPFLVTMGLGWLGILRARQAYCDRCARWRGRQLAFFNPGLGQPLVEAAEKKEWYKWVGTPQIVVGSQQSQYAAAMVEFCESQHRVDPCPVVVSVKEVKTGGGIMSLTQWDQVIGRTLLWRMPLSEAESSELSSLFPRLTDLAANEQSATTARISKVGGLEVWAVSPRYAGLILNARTKSIANALRFAAIGLLLVGAALAAGGAWWFTRVADDLELPMTPGWLMMGTGVSLAAVFGFIVKRNPSWLGNRYLLRRARQQTELRPDRIVRGNDPQALFVEIIPRKNWGRLASEAATDIGFLKIDERAKAILFEGDHQRYRIPATVITDIQPEQFAIGQGTDLVKVLYAIVVTARASNGAPWEAPVIIRRTTLQEDAAAREQDAIELYGRCVALLPSENDKKA